LNTAKQVNVMIGLMFVGLFGTFLYFLFDNGFNAFGMDFEGRESAAVIRQEKTNVERGGALFALNCRACHGLTGQGPLELAGLPGLPLNVEGNRPGPDVSEAQVEAKADRFNGTITCGRVGTLMPPWSTEEDGALNAFQIEQLVKLITSEFSEEGWTHAVEQANHADQFAPRKTLTAALGPDDTIIDLNDASGLLADGTLRIGGDTIDAAYEILLIVSVNEAAGTLTVERGASGSNALSHEAGAEVYNGPIEPPNTILGLPDTTPPCGQRNVQPQASPGPAVTITVTGDVTFSMGDNFFDLDGSVNPTLEIAAGSTVNLTLPNTGLAVHNLRIAGPDGEYNTEDDFVSDPALITGGTEGTLEFTPGEAGTFPYRCDFHPTEMLGEVSVTG
jgi:mono/diheme cytochrome c family protein/plastocyanin